VNLDPVPLPDIGMGLGIVMTGLLMMVAIGAMIHMLGAEASAGVLLANVPLAVPEIKGQLDAILAGIKDQKAEVDEIKKQYGESSKEFKTAMEAFAAIQKQVDALDAKLTDAHRGPGGGPNLVETLREDARLQDWIKTKRGTCFVQIKGDHIAELMERKTTIDSAALGTATSGVLQIDRTPGIVEEARQGLRLRNVIRSRPTSLPTIDFVKVNSAPSAGSIQTEGSAKSENAVTFTTGTAYVKTIVSWIPMTRQAMDDFDELMGYIRNALPYYVNLREEIEFLHGGGGSTDILGLVPQATAFNTALLSLTPGWNKSDMINAAIQQIEIANEIDPTFVVLHPTDYWQILRTKDANRNYIFNNNNIGIDPFWGLTPIRTNKMGAGNFLIGSGNPVAVEIRDRMDMELAISAEHGDFFVQNKVAVRAEKRVALPTYRPGSFIFGSFTTSP
jgi:HK97 family phage major capsid protein